MLCDTELKSVEQTHLTIHEFRYYSTTHRSTDSKHVQPLDCLKLLLLVIYFLVITLIEFGSREFAISMILSVSSGGGYNSSYTSVRSEFTQALDTCKNPYKSHTVVLLLLKDVLAALNYLITSSKENPPSNSLAERSAAESVLCPINLYLRWWVNRCRSRAWQRNGTPSSHFR